MPSLSSRSFSSPNIVSLGRVQRPKGLQGQMRVTTRGEILSQLKTGDTVELYQAEGTLDGYLKNPVRHGELTIQNVISVFSDYIVLSAQHFNTLESVEQIQGLYFGLDRTNLPPWFRRNPNEFYLFEYVGLRVQDGTGKFYGQIVRVEDNSASPLLVIKLDKTRQEILLPQEAPYVSSPKRGQDFLVIENISDFM